MSFELPYDAFLRITKEQADIPHSFLLGAGASISSGIQTAQDCIWEWKRNIFTTQNPSLAGQYNTYRSETVQRAIQKWLDTQGSYPQENSHDEYTFYANASLPIEETRRKYFENICKGKEPYVGYKILCQLAKKGMVKSVFTTNFDNLVERAAHQSAVNPIPISLSTQENIHTRIPGNNEMLCVSLHGDYKYGPLKNTAEELDNQSDTFVKALKNYFADKHLIVIGYSGRDTSLMECLKQAFSEPGGGMLFWCGYGHEITPNVESLLSHVNSVGRKGFYVPTDGFDTTMINIASTCFHSDANFQKELEQIIQKNTEDKTHRSPFRLEIQERNILLKSNLFPISLPSEVFQFETDLQSIDHVWQFISGATQNKNVNIIPLKGFFYGFGTQSDLRNTFGSIIKSDIKRTPVTYKEIKEGSSFKRLYLSTVTKTLAQLYNLNSNQKDKIWNNEFYTVTKNGVSYNVHNAVRLNLFFDHSAYSDRPYAYLSIDPTFHIISTGEITKDIKFEIGKSYSENLIKGQPNVKFNEQIEKWKNIFFPQNNRIEFEYPLESGTGFKFKIGSDTAHVGLMKNFTPRYRLNLPTTFNPKKIVYSGIQYGEPRLDFLDRISGKYTSDFHPMRGLSKHRPYDFNLNNNIFEPEINVAVICPKSNSQSLHSFLTRLNNTSQAGKNNPDYLIDYPGFLQAYGVPLNLPDPNSEIWKDSTFSPAYPTALEAGRALADTLKRYIDQLEQLRKRTIIVIFIPKEWNYITDVQEGHEHFDLHDYLKAYAAQKQIATQFIQEETLSDNLVCQINWWLSLSFYVKALRTPWVLQGLQPDTAFVGIGYSINHRAKDNKVVLGCSHIYNSLGQGLKYRLSKVEDCTFDSQNNPFLSYQDAYKFGTMIRELFLNTNNELPKRVVVHKRTHFKRDEINGIIDSLGKTGIKQIDLIEINFEPDAKFISMFANATEVKPAAFPLSRGSCFLLDDYTALLWTHGIVSSVRNDNYSYFQGGKGMPIPLKIKKHYGHTNINSIANEILGLTKMNWNSFNLYSKLPATIQSSNEIAKIGWLLSRFEGKTYDYRNFM